LQFSSESLQYTKIPSLLEFEDHNFGAAMMISRSCVTFTGNNIFSDNLAPSGGSLYIFESVVTLTGINTFRNNTSAQFKDTFDSRCLQDDKYDWVSGSGGAIYCSSSTLNINSKYSVFANNFAQDSGGAIHARDGNIAIKGSVTFMKNIAYQYEGGAMLLQSMTLIVSGDISFINNEALSGGALSITIHAKFLIVGEERMANKKSTFNDATKLCGNVAMYGDMASIDSYSSKFNDSGKRVAVFRGNIAILEGGGIKCISDSDISILDGSIRFENNTAMFGGGMYLGDYSKLILSPTIQKDVSFVLNHARRFGGSLYVDDSQCSTHRKDCFLSIYGDNPYTATKL
jgi:predicted outer membrane repeat protein